MTFNNSNNQKKSDQFIDEVISPMFGYDYQNRVVPSKHKEKHEKTFDFENSETSYLEKQIEEELEAQSKIAKAKEYQETFQTDTDVLEEYYQQKRREQIQAALPSNYLDFRDTLEKKSDPSLISSFDSIGSVSDNTFSDVIDDIFAEKID